VGLNGGVAWGYFGGLVGSTGTGSVGNVHTVTVVASVPSPSLVPGSPGTLAFTATNTRNVPVELTTVRVSAHHPPASTTTTSCSGPRYLIGTPAKFGPPTNAYGAYPLSYRLPSPIIIPARSGGRAGVVSSVIATAVLLSATAPAGCQHRTFVVQLVFTAELS
jgi:hypothetical protein